VLSLDGGLSIPNVTFGQADTMDKSFMDDPLDGVFGLAFQLIAVDNVVPPINQAINNHLLDDPIFT
jgi:cathepsin D